MEKYESSPVTERLKSGVTRANDYRNIEDYEEIISEDEGYMITYGREYGKIKNIACLVEHKVTKERYYKVSCNSDHSIFTRISCEDMEIIRSSVPRNTLTLHKGTGYVIINGRTGSKNRYLHDFILRKKDPTNEKINDKHYTVDHYPNTSKLDNRRLNLRWATQSEQNRNRGKKARSKSAKPLPAGLTQDMMPKHVGYYSECLNKEKQLYREFFKIEKHPKCEKPICGSKSGKISIQEKLTEIKKKLANIENGILEDNANKLPPYYRISNIRSSPHMCFEKKTPDKRYGMNMKLKKDVPVDVELERLNKRLYDKYPELVATEINDLIESI